MAPYLVSTYKGKVCLKGTYGLGADIRVPDLCLKAHDRRPERVLAGDLDVDMEGAALVRCVWRSEELASEMCEVVA
jgi:hypothetical protein